MKKITSLFVFSFIALISYSQTLSASDYILYWSCNASEVELLNTTPPQSPPLYYQWIIDGITYNVGTSQAPFNHIFYGGDYYNFTILNAFYDSTYNTSAFGITHIVQLDTCSTSPLSANIISSQLPSQNSCDSNMFILEANATGGNAPYTYVWSVWENGLGNSPSLYFGQNQNLFLANNTYIELEITDNSLDIAVEDETLYVNTSSNLTAFATHNTLSSDCDSSTIQFWGVSNDSTASYEWIIQTGNNWDTSFVQNPILTFENLNNNYGVAQLIVTNNGGCIASTLYTFQFQGNSLTGYADIANYSNNQCVAGSCDFEIVLHATSGQSPFLYSLNQGTPTTVNAFNSLCAGYYEARIEDATGCVVEFTVIVEDVDSLQVYESHYYATCDSNGQGGTSYISAYASNSTTVWSNGYTGNSLQNPTPNSIYTYIVTDNITGCTASGSFTIPSSNCYTISGNVYADLDGDCIFNNNDYAINSVWVDLADANGNWLWNYDFTDANGFYSISAAAGTYYFDVNGVVVNNFTQACPASGFSVTIGPGNPNPVVDFYMTPPAPIQDLRVSLYSITTFTPGFPYWASLQYCNDGTIPMSGTVVMNYDNNLTYIVGSSFGAVNDAVNHTLTWTFSNLTPGNCIYTGPDFTVSTSAVLGNTMSNTVVINPINGDVTPNNNTAYVVDTIVGSWDPNDKVVYPQAGMLQSEKDHDYRIRFQNKGTAPATFVIVRDNLDDNLDLHTLRNVSASHSFVMTVENTDELVFTFNNIMLPAEQDDEPGSHGSIYYTISQKEDLPLGTTIENTAYIYFDFNDAVITNTTLNTIIEKTTGIGVLANNVKVNVFPNPSNGMINIVSESMIKTIEVFNIIGEKVFKTEGINNSKALLKLENTVDGVYLIKIETEKGIVFKKVSISNKK